MTDSESNPGIAGEEELVLKKILYIIFLGILICGVLTGCGKKQRHYSTLQECYDSGYFDAMLKDIPTTNGFKFKTKAYYIDPNTVQFVFSFDKDISETLPSTIIEVLNENMKDIDPQMQNVIKGVLEDIDIDAMSIMMTFTTYDMRTITEHTFTYPPNIVFVYD